MTDVHRAGLEVSDTTRPVGRLAPVLGALLAAGTLLAAALLLTPVRTDIARFLPEGRTPAGRLMLEELRTGAAGRVLLAGVEGAGPADLARVTTAMAAALRGTGRFRVVAAGDAALPSAEEQAALFARRYLLADAALDEASLHAALTALLRALRSSAGPVAAAYGFADPTGAFTAALRAWGGSGRVRAQDGAWFDPDRDRALLVAVTAAAGMDAPAQAVALGAVQSAFRDAAAGVPGARLLVSGPAVFAQAAEAAVKRDVRLVSVTSALLVLALLAWRFRSLLVLAAIGAPLLLGIAAATVATGAAFGGVQAAALGLGAAMAGVAVDYPVLLIGHRKRGEAGAATRARIGPAFRLAVATAVLGLGGMVLSGLPGLQQLGVFSAAALAATAAATWWLLPRLVVAADLAPVAASDLTWLPRVERARRHRAWALLPAAAALAAAALAGGVRWETDLAALSPVPDAARTLDAELRGALGATDAGQLLIVRGRDAEEVLRQQEALRPLLTRLQGDGAVGASEYAAQLVPSVAAQAARRAALPSRDALAARLAAARDGLPYRVDAFQPFLDGVAATAGLSPLRPADLDGTALGARLSPLLAPSGPDKNESWRGPVTFRDVRDPARLRAAFAGLDPTEATYVDVRAELGGVLAGYTSGAWRWLAVCAGLAAAVLAAGLRRDLGRLPRVAGPVLAAVLLTAALLTAAGARLSLVHVVALQLVAGVGFDYALFFSRPQLDDEERARTMRTLVTCNLMTLLTFGALALCRTPFLRDIGVTVALGAGLAMAAAFLFAGPVPDKAPA